MVDRRRQEEQVVDQEGFVGLHPVIYLFIIVVSRIVSHRVVCSSFSCLEFSPLD